MAQNDFDCLGMPYQSDDLMLDACIGLRPPSSDTDRKAASADGDDDYVPVNYIPEAVYSMIKAWELKRHDIMEVSSSMSLSATAASSTDALRLEDYVPMRICAQAAQPKRFYRTFWRSVARRLSEADKEADLAAKQSSNLTTERKCAIHD